jgi:hypothetical protein
LKKNTRIKPMHRQSPTLRWVRRALLGATVLAFFGADLLAAQSWRDYSASRLKGSESELHVTIEYGAGELEIAAADDADVLYRMDLRYDEERFEPIAEFERGRLELGVESVRRNLGIRGKSEASMILALGRDVPMDLDLEFGAVKAEIDLGGLALTELTVETGASQSRIDVSEPNPERLGTASLSVGAADFQAVRLGNLNADRIDVNAGVGDVTLDFTGEWRRDGEISVDMGLGALELRFPKGLGVHLKKDGFLASLDSEGLIKRGDSYYSPDWDGATHRVTVEIDAAFGSIDVVWVR